MNKKIELIIIRLESENAQAKKLLSFLKDKLTEKQVNTLLDTINTNSELIERLKKEL